MASTTKPRCLQEALKRLKNRFQPHSNLRRINLICRSDRTGPSKDRLFHRFRTGNCIQHLLLDHSIDAIDTFSSTNFRGAVNDHFGLLRFHAQTGILCGRVSGMRSLLLGWCVDRPLKDPADLLRQIFEDFFGWSLPFHLNFQQFWNQHWIHLSPFSYRCNQSGSIIHDITEMSITFQFISLDLSNHNQHYPLNRYRRQRIEMFYSMVAQLTDHGIDFVLGWKLIQVVFRNLN